MPSTLWSEGEIGDVNYEIEELRLAAAPPRPLPI